MTEKISIEEMMRKYSSEVSMISSRFDERLELMYCNNKIKLDKLYEIIEEYGGFNEVKKLNLFSQVAKKLGLDFGANSTCIDLYTSMKSLYDQYLKNFDIWYKEQLKDISLKKNRTSLRSHQRKHIQTEIDSISYNLFETAQKRADDIGINSIFTSLASGFPNEIETTLDVLIELSQYQNYCEILIKMRSLRYLLPAIVGIFQETHIDGQMNIEYLTKLPDIVKLTNYIKRALISHERKYYSLFFSDINEYITELKDKNNQTLSEINEFFLSRINKVLTILYNLSFENFEMSSKDPIHRLLLLVLILCEDNYKRKCWKIISNLTLHMIIEDRCTFTPILIHLMASNLLTTSRTTLCNILMCIFNLTTNATNSTVDEYFATFDTSIIIELISLCDSEISFYSLLSLQAMTIKNPIRCHPSLIFNYFDLISNVLKNTYLFDPFFDQRVEKMFVSSSSNRLKLNPKIKITEEHKDVANKWFCEHYYKINGNDYLTKSLKLSDVLIDLIDNFSTSSPSYIQCLIVCVLRLIPNYTVLLEGTILSIDFSNKEKLIELLKCCCTNNILYQRTEEPSDLVAGDSIPLIMQKLKNIHHVDNESILDTLNSIQALRLYRLNKNACNNSTLNYHLLLSFQNSHSDSMLSSNSKNDEKLEELDDAYYCEDIETIKDMPKFHLFLSSSAVLAKEDVNTSRECSRYMLIAAHVISNICFRNDTLKRYFQQYHLDEIIVQNECSKSLLSVLGNILR